MKTFYTEQLRNGTCVVEFTKKNGDHRIMNCTLQSDFITQHNLTPVGGGAAVYDNQVRCVDVDIMEWRSFNIDSVTSFKFKTTDLIG